MSLFDTIGGWIDTGVDWVAEAFDYKDIVEVGTAEEFTAGQQLVRDVKDTFGFIQKPLDAYAKVSGLDKTKETGQYFTPTQRIKQPRNVADLTSGSRAYTMTNPVTGNPVNTGYMNPDVRSYLTALAQNSYNQQMNNMFASYIVSPTKTSGQKTIGIGTTGVKGVTKKQKTARRERGLTTT